MAIHEQDTAEDIGAEDSQADYGMYSSAGNTIVDEIINNGVELVKDAMSAGTDVSEIASSMQSFVREQSSASADEHSEINDTVVQSNIVDYIIADAERLHGITLPSFD